MEAPEKPAEQRPVPQPEKPPRSDPGRTTKKTIAEPRDPKRHTHTVVIDFEKFVKDVKGVPDPDAQTITYATDAIDLLTAASDDAQSFRRAAKGAPKGAGWLEQLRYIPDDLFATAYDLISNHQQSPMFYEDGQAGTAEYLAERIMNDHVLDFGFFSHVYDFFRYAEPETSEAHGGNLL